MTLDSGRRTAAHTNTILALSVMQFRQEGRDGALRLLREDEVSERLGGVRRKREEGRQADQELFEEGGDSCWRERSSASESVAEWIGSAARTREDTKLSQRKGCQQQAQNHPIPRLTLPMTRTTGTHLSSCTNKTSALSPVGNMAILCRACTCSGVCCWKPPRAAMAACIRSTVSLLRVNGMSKALAMEG